MLQQGDAVHTIVATLCIGKIAMCRAKSSGQAGAVGGRQLVEVHNADEASRLILGMRTTTASRVRLDSIVTRRHYM